MLNPMTLTDISQRLNEDHGANNLPAGFFITDRKAVTEPEEVIRRLPRGFGVIMRDYDHPERHMLAQSLAEFCRAREIVFLLAGDQALAGLVGADGIHLPEGLRGNAVSLRVHNPDWLITTSCHGMSSLATASLLPIDAALIAPVFPTLSHPQTLTGKEAVLGLPGLRQMVKSTDLPLYALGGITRDNATQLTGTGLAGIAAIRGFL